MTNLDMFLRLNPSTEVSLHLTAQLDGQSVLDVLQTALDREFERRARKRAALTRNRQAARFDVIGP